MTQVRTYPTGVPCWIDVHTPDPDGAARFYGELMGWTLTDAAPPGGGSYLIATLDGQDVAAIVASENSPAVWNTYVATADADRTAERVGGRRRRGHEPAGRRRRRRTLGHRPRPDRRGVPPVAAGPAAGRAAHQRARRLELQRPPHRPARRRAGLLRRRLRVGGRPAGLRRGPAGADGAPAGVRRPPRGDGRPRHPRPPGRHLGPARLRRRDRLGRRRWSPARRRTGTSRSPSRTATSRCERAAHLGATVVGAPRDTAWTRDATLRDPAGAVFTVSQFTPPRG